MYRRGLLLLGGLLLLPALGTPAASPLSTPVLDWQLPADLRHPEDVRWLDDATLLINDALQGLWKVRLSGPEPEPVLEHVRPLADETRPWVHLGLSASHLAGAGYAFRTWWEQRTGQHASGSLTVEYVADLDLHEDRLLLVGLRRDDAGELGADGSMAWLIRPQASNPTPRPVLPFPAGALESLQDCAALRFPKARFLDDGSFLILAGTEPGLFLYTPTGRLQRTWDTEALGLEQECEPSREQARRFGTDIPLRQGWLNQKRVVDEILPLPSGPALLVRSRADGVTRWELLRLASGGDAQATPTLGPTGVTSPSGWASARGDVRNGRIAVLVSTSAPKGQTVPPSRLLIFKVEP